METMRWWTKPGLAIGIYGLVAASLALSVILEDKTTTSMIVGAIIGEFARASGFFFGSSDGSQKKDEIIKDQSAALATSAPVAPIVTTTTTDARADTTTTTTEPAKPGETR